MSDSDKMVKNKICGTHSLDLSLSKNSVILLFLFLSFFLLLHSSIGFLFYFYFFLLLLLLSFFLLHTNSTTNNLFFFFFFFFFFFIFLFLSFFISSSNPLHHQQLFFFFPLLPGYEGPFLDSTQVQVETRILGPLLIVWWIGLGSPQLNGGWLQIKLCASHIKLLKARMRFLLSNKIPL